ncbi:hypothetical protein Mgra_00008287, partial [Meloidogyne graminicola]
MIKSASCSERKSLTTGSSELCEALLA